MWKSAFLAVVLLAIIGCEPKAKWDYSEGDRTGTVSKFSYKKVLDTADDVPKSWEGVGAMDDDAAWQFAVANEDTTVIQAIKDAVASHQRVVLHYVQCNGGVDPRVKGHISDYLIKKVTPAGAR